MNYRGSATAVFELGSVVADRRLDAIAGRGGMGVVYRAWNLRLKRVEAVKVVAQEFAQDQSFHDRFEREIEIAAAIDHPHVVTIYDCGDGPAGELFIAMRYVEGTTLKRLIMERGQLDPELASSLITQVASALDAAHAQGLVHRDVKPENILLAGSEAEYRAYLTDFGLAKRLSSETVLTSTGMFVGTVDYMAPEQAQGRPVDQRADIYALGATLFRALTGQVPFPGDQDVTKLLAKVRDVPPLPSQIAPNVPQTFDPVLARALSTDPAQRYRSAGELARAAATASSRSPAVAGQRPLPASRGFSQPVLALCENALGAIGEPEARSAMQEVRRELVAPLRLAILGRSASERAALMTALLGRQLSDGQAAELTPAISITATDQAEAFVVLVTATTADAVHAALLGGLDGVTASAVNCVCVLNAEDPDGPRQAADRAKKAIKRRETADRAKKAIGPLVASVVPVGVTASGGAEASELRELWQQIHRVHERIDAIRAARALDALEELSFRDRTLAFLRDRVESIRFEPRMHMLDLIAALQRCVSDDVELPADLLTKLEQLVTAGAAGQRLGVDDADAAGLSRAALAELRTWKAFENGGHASPAARRIAEAVSRSLQVIAREAERGDITG